MPSLFDLARRRVGTDGGIADTSTRTLGMPGGTPGPTGYGSPGAGGSGFASAGQGLKYGGATDVAGTWSPTRTLGIPGGSSGGWQSKLGSFAPGQGLQGGMGGGLGNGGGWTNMNNPLSGGLLGNLPAFNQPTGWANGVDPKYMGGVTQGGRGGALPGAMNQWLNNPALKEAQQAFQAQMRGNIARQMQEAGAIGGGQGNGGDVFGGAPPEWLVAQNQALQQFAQGLAGKSNQEIDAMYQALVDEAALNKNTPANQLTNKKMQALRNYGKSQGWYNWQDSEGQSAMLRAQNDIYSNGGTEKLPGMPG